MQPLGLNPPFLVRVMGQQGGDGAHPSSLPVPRGCLVATGPHALCSGRSQSLEAVPSCTLKVQDASNRWKRLEEEAPTFTEG